MLTMMKPEVESSKRDPCPEAPLKREHAPPPERKFRKCLQSFLEAQALSPGIQTVTSTWSRADV